MELAAAMRRDDRRAFAEVLEQHAGIVFKVVNSYASNPDDRADLGQEIAAQLWRAWPGYDPSRSLTTWMYRIALNVAISHLRGRSLRERHHVPLEEGLHDAAHHDADGAGERELLLQRVLGGLAPLDRALLLLHLEDRSHREIAEVLGLRESNVGTRLSRLKQRIRQQLSPDAGA